METVLRRSFERDLRALARREKNKDVRRRIGRYMEEIKSQFAAEESVQDVRRSDIKKLRGGEGYYRARIGDYRLGLQVVEGRLEFVRLLHRSDIYKHFP